MAADANDARSAGARAPLIEIFHSIQGEGRFVGRPMAFLRVATCPIRCRYCDTRNSYAAPREVRVGAAEVRNPVTAVQAADLVLDAADASPWREAGALRVSVTGGEPLVFPTFVAALHEALARAAAERGHTETPVLHLETALLDPEALDQCVEALGHLSADYKLPSTLEGRVDHGPQHVEALRRAAARDPGRLSIDVKIVLTADHTDAEFDAALRDLEPFRGRIELFLQPVTPQPHLPAALPSQRLEAAFQRATLAGFAPRVLPQLHPVLGVE